MQQRLATTAQTFSFCNNRLLLDIFKFQEQEQAGKAQATSCTMVLDFLKPKLEGSALVHYKFIVLMTIHPGKREE